ncbi:protein of unknown function [Nitratireductor aquimarinus]
MLRSLPDRLCCTGRSQHYHERKSHAEALATELHNNRTALLSYSLKCQKYQHQTRRKCKFFAQNTK